MSHKIRILEDLHILDLLSHIPQPPKSLYIRGTLPLLEYKIITIVGSRRCSEYSKQVIREICASLKGQKVSIVSGLATGVDSFVHQQALENQLHTMAVVGSGLEDTVIYPQSNLKLAHKILNAGGALISEQEPAISSRIWMFPARNRIMVGLSSLIIIIEAREKSGTLITARLATDYNRDVLVVPNSIYSTYSKGSNELIKQGAYAYTRPQDIFELLKLDIQSQSKLLLYVPTVQEELILKTIQNGNTSTEKIIHTCCSKISIPEILQGLLNLEIENLIKKIDGTYYVL